MEQLIRMFNPQDVDPITIAEVKHFAQLKYDEQEKIKGQIARDLFTVSGKMLGKTPLLTPNSKLNTRRRTRVKRNLLSLNEKGLSGAHEKTK